ncbi:MAG TPA: TraB/GumN family protein [Pseudobdellovibrionaceae bacterium]|nr:TraB/GumN family protein [Pseudobdellovibrionaceae bacterium]
MKSLKFRTYLFICFALFFSACATDPKYFVSKPFLYEVTKDTQKAYLFGTIHLGVATDDFPNEFWKYFDESEQLLPESDNLSESDLKEIDKLIILKLKKDVNAPKVTELMNAENAENVKNFIYKIYPENGLDIINTLSPFGVYSVIVEHFFSINDYIISRGEAIRMSQRFMMDFDLIKKARRSKKSIIPLDEPSQESIINCILNDDKYYIEQIIKFSLGQDVLVNLQENFKLIYAYRAGNEGFFKTEFSNMTNKQCLIDERNKLWMPKIKTQMEKSGIPFIAVGVGHVLNSEGSLIHLFEKEGYRVVPLFKEPVKD